MSNVPENLLYTKEHEWIEVKDGVATIGITDYAQNSLGDIVFVELPDVGDTIEAGGTIGVVESIKSVSDLYSPIQGEVIEKNDDVESSPEEINNDAFGSWLIKVKLSSEEEIQTLLKSSDYQAFCDSL